MKKLMFVAVAALCGSLLADSTVISSANLVGYQQHSLNLADENDYAFDLGVNFKNMAGEDGAYVITDNFFGTDLNVGDQIFIFDNLMYGYSVYEFTELEGGVTGFTVLLADGTLDDPVTSITLNKGDCAVMLPTDLTIKPTVAGEVEKSGTAVIDMSCEESDEGYAKPIVNPFPIDTTLGDLAKWLVLGDQIFVWNSEMYGYTMLEFTELEGGINGFTVLMADGTLADPISDPETVILKAGFGGIYLPSDFNGRTWEVTLNY